MLDNHQMPEIWIWGHLVPGGRARLREGLILQSRLASNSWRSTYYSLADAVLTDESRHIWLKGIFPKEASGSEGKASNIFGYTNREITDSFAWSQSTGEMWQAQVRSYSEIKKKEISANPQVWIQKNTLFRSKGETHFSYKIISIRGQGESSVSTSTHSSCLLTWNPYRKPDGCRGYVHGLST